MRVAKKRFVPAFDPYSYTQGRWLDRDSERRSAREVRFDFDALLNEAVKTSKGAREVVSCEKKEGGFNRVFIIGLDNGSSVIARLPTRLAGPPGLTMSSEVATLEYVREKTKVPVPRVLAWDIKGETGAVGAEYMILDAVPGVPLKDVWSQMTGLQHIECIESIGQLSKELCNLDFPAYGSLYYNSTNDLPEAVPLDTKYCIGPHCAPQLWDCGVEKTARSSTPRRVRGPWQDLSTYFSNLIDIARSATIQAQSLGNSSARHLRLLGIYSSTVQMLIETEIVKASAKPTLFHPDFHARNIFVAVDDPTRVTGVIDWQAAAIEPAFVHAAETPDFTEEMALDQVLDADRSDVKNDAQEDSQRCAKTWAVLAYLCPKLGQAIALDPFLCRYLATAAAGWLDDAVSVESLLTDLNSRWADLGVSGACLYIPGQPDADVLNAKLDELKSTRRLRMYLARLLRCETDGLVETGRWEEVLPVYRAEFEDFVASCKASREEGESESEAVAKAERLWPFDLR